MSKVSNPKKEVLPDVNSFNDEDILIDTQVSLKHINTELGLLIQEASNKTLTKEVESISKEISKMQRDSFNLMFEYGWYTLEEQKDTKVSEEYIKFKTKEEQFN